MATEGRPAKSQCFWLLILPLPSQLLPDGLFHSQLPRCDHPPISSPMGFPWDNAHHWTIVHYWKVLQEQVLIFLFSSKGLFIPFSVCGVFVGFFLQLSIQWITPVLTPSEGLGGVRKPFSMATENVNGNCSARALPTSLHLEKAPLPPAAAPLDACVAHYPLLSQENAEGLGS